MGVIRGAVLGGPLGTLIGAYISPFFFQGVSDLSDPASASGDGASLLLGLLGGTAGGTALGAFLGTILQVEQE